MKKSRQQSPHPSNPNSVSNSDEGPLPPGWTLTGLPPSMTEAFRQRAVHRIATRFIPMLKHRRNLRLKRQAAQSKIRLSAKDLQIALRASGSSLFSLAGEANSSAIIDLCIDEGTLSSHATLGEIVIYAGEPCAPAAWFLVRGRLDVFPAAVSWHSPNLTTKSNSVCPSYEQMCRLSYVFRHGVNKDATNNNNNSNDHHTSSSAGGAGLAGNSNLNKSTNSADGKSTLSRANSFVSTPTSNLHNTNERHTSSSAATNAGPNNNMNTISGSQNSTSTETLYTCAAKGGLSRYVHGRRGGTEIRAPRSLCDLASIASSHFTSFYAVPLSSFDPQQAALNKQQQQQQANKDPSSPTINAATSSTDNSVLILRISRETLNKIYTRYMTADQRDKLLTSKLTEFREQQMMLAFPLHPLQINESWLFRGIGNETLRALTRTAIPFALTQGQPIAQRGKRLAHILFIQRGLIVLLDEKQETKMILGPGSVYGEREALFRERLTVSVVALSNVDILALSLKTVQHQCASSDTAKAILNKNAAERRQRDLHASFEASGGRLVESVRKTPLLPVPELAESLLPLLKPRVFSAGEHIVDSTTECDRIVYLTRGCAVIRGLRDENGGEVLFHRGECVGFTCLVSHRWQRTIVAAEPVDTWELSRMDYYKWLKKHTYIPTHEDLFWNKAFAASVAKLWSDNKNTNAFDNKPVVPVVANVKRNLLPLVSLSSSPSKNNSNKNNNNNVSINPSSSLQINNNTNIISPQPPPTLSSVSKLVPTTTTATATATSGAISTNTKGAPSHYIGPSFMLKDNGVVISQTENEPKTGMPLKLFPHLFSVVVGRTLQLLQPFHVNEQFARDEKLDKFAMNPILLYGEELGRAKKRTGGAGFMSLKQNQNSSSNNALPARRKSLLVVVGNEESGFDQQDAQRQNSNNNDNDNSNQENANPLLLDSAAAMELLSLDGSMTANNNLLTPMIIDENAKNDPLSVTFVGTNGEDQTQQQEEKDNNNSTNENVSEEVIKARRNLTLSKIALMKEYEGLDEYEILLHQHQKQLAALANSTNNNNQNIPLASSATTREQRNTLPWLDTPNMHPTTFEPHDVVFRPWVPPARPPSVASVYGTSVRSRNGSNANGDNDDSGDDSPPHQKSTGRGLLVNLDIVAGPRMSSSSDDDDSDLEKTEQEHFNKINGDLFGSHHHNKTGKNHGGASQDDANLTRAERRRKLLKKMQKMQRKAAKHNSNNNTFGLDDVSGSGLQDRPPMSIFQPAPGSYGDHVLDQFGTLRSHTYTLTTAAQFEILARHRALLEKKLSAGARLLQAEQQRKNAANLLLTSAVQNNNMGGENNNNNALRPFSAEALAAFYDDLDEDYEYSGDFDSNPFSAAHCVVESDFLDLLYPTKLKARKRWKQVKHLGVGIGKGEGETAEGDKNDDKFGAEARKDKMETNLSQFTRAIRESFLGTGTGSGGNNNNNNRGGNDDDENDSQQAMISGRASRADNNRHKSSLQAGNDSPASNMGLNATDSININDPDMLSVGRISSRPPLSRYVIDKCMKHHKQRIAGPRHQIIKLAKIPKNAVLRDVTPEAQSLADRKRKQQQHDARVAEKEQKEYDQEKQKRIIQNQLMIAKNGGVANTNTTPARGKNQKSEGFSNPNNNNNQLRDRPSMMDLHQTNTLQFSSSINTAMYNASGTHSPDDMLSSGAGDESTTRYLSSEDFNNNNNNSNRNQTSSRQNVNNFVDDDDDGDYSYSGDEDETEDQFDQHGRMIREYDNTTSHLPVSSRLAGTDRPKWKPAPPLQVHFLAKGRATAAQDEKAQRNREIAKKQHDEIQRLIAFSRTSKEELSKGNINFTNFTNSNDQKAAVSRPSTANNSLQRQQRRRKDEYEIVPYLMEDPQDESKNLSKTARPPSANQNDSLLAGVFATSRTGNLVSKQKPRHTSLVELDRMWNGTGTSKAAMEEKLQNRYAHLSGHVTSATELNGSLLLNWRQATQNSYNQEKRHHHKEQKSVLLKPRKPYRPEVDNSYFFYYKENQEIQRQALIRQQEEERKQEEFEQELRRRRNKAKQQQQQEAQDDEEQQQHAGTSYGYYQYNDEDGQYYYVELDRAEGERLYREQVLREQQEEELKMRRIRQREMQKQTPSHHSRGVVLGGSRQHQRFHSDDQDDMMMMLGENENDMLIN